MFSIGEFARFGSVSVRMLRHYDEIGLLRPARVDPGTGYRSYSASQLPLLNRIVALKELGFTLDEVGRLTDGVTADELRGMLLLRRSQLEQELAEHEARLRGVEARLRHIEREGTVPNHDITAKPLPAVRIAAVARPAPGFGPDNLVPVIQPAFDELFTAIGEADIEPKGFPFACYTGEAGEGTLVVHCAVPVAGDADTAPEPAALYELPPVEHGAVLVWRGNLENAHDEIYQFLPRWIEDNGFVPVGAGRDVFVDMFPDNPDEAVMEVHWPLRRPDGPPPDITPHPVG